MELSSTSFQEKPSTVREPENCGIGRRHESNN